MGLDVELTGGWTEFISVVVLPDGFKVDISIDKELDAGPEVGVVAMETVLGVGEADAGIVSIEKNYRCLRFQ